MSEIVSVIVIGLVATIAVVGLVYITGMAVRFMGAIKFNEPELLKPTAKKKESYPESTVYGYDDTYAANVEDAVSHDIGSFNQTGLESILGRKY